MARTGTSTAGRSASCKPQSRPFEFEYRRWLVDLARSGKAPRTLECYARDLRDAEREICVLTGRPATSGDLAAVGQREVDAICSAWERAGASVQTVLRRFAALRGFARHLATTDRINCSGLLCARLPRVRRSTCEAIEAESVLALTGRRPLPEPGSWTELRDTAIFALIASTGMTPSETVGLDRAQAFGRGGAIRITSTHLEPRIVAASQDAEATVRKYLAALPPGLSRQRPLFVNRRGGRLNVRSVQVSFRRRCASFGIRVAAGPMGLRHAAGDALARADGSPEALARALGISVATASKYFQTTALVGRR